ncbi:alpha/beta fold hydrolase [Brevibacillus laterosporus]|uniref:Type I polyketide synthase n=1 Tax=Brevibacillus halotolerans TaxID=1507437 RepID=A0ABT4I2B5_9BACL|nr:MULTISPECIES: type I polyketide synthase [Brevibacillus]MCR8987468.1 alpha/beta fold hydrolase [Brevibacillus laterosporus]MCZ0833205.1 type I polyketide synthase [Brevibacillus halotolerans]
MKQTQVQETFLQRLYHSHYLVQDHRVHGICAVPGLALMDMVYRVAALYVDKQPIELRQVLFKHPIVTSEYFDKNIYVTFAPIDSYWKVTITSQKIKDDVIIDQQMEVNMECFMYVMNNRNNSQALDVQAFMKQSTKQWDMDQMYDLVRKTKIFHDTFMKTEGTVYKWGNQELMELRLSSLAESYLDQFYAHAAFLDGSCLAGASFMVTGMQYNIFQENTPYIPFMLERFCIYKPLPNKVYTYTEQTTIQEKISSAPDIVSRDITIFNEGGDVLVEYNKFTVKRVREPQLIKKLTQTRSLQISDTAKAHSIAHADEQNEMIQPAKTIHQGRESPHLASIQIYLQQEIADVLKINAENVQTNTGFYELGLDSTQLLGLVKVLENKVKTALYPTLLFEYSTVESLSQYLLNHFKPFFVTEHGTTKPPESRADLICSYLQQEIASVLQTNPKDIPLHTGFYELGLDSTNLLSLVKVLEKKVDAPLYPTLLFEYSTVAKLSEYLLVNWGEAFIAEAKVDTEEIAVSPLTSKLQAEQATVLYFNRHWKQLGLKEASSSDISRKQVVLLFHDDMGLQAELKRHLQLETVFALKSDKVDIIDQFQAKCKECLVYIQELLQQKPVTDILIQIVAGSGEVDKYAEALEGMLRTAYLEQPKIHSQIIHFENLNKMPAHEIAVLLEKEARCHDEGVASIQYRGKDLSRYVYQLREMTPRSTPRSHYVMEHGVYVITGGLGGLGYLLAGHLAQQGGIKLALLGRSRLDQKKQQQIYRLMEMGADVRYIEVDLCIQADTAQAFESIREELGPITGIFHCAGVIQDRLLLHKDSNDLQAVLSPKWKGTWNVDRATEDDELEFFVLFSSVSAIMGNVGQADYACANASMDLFALQRQELVNSGKRCGQTFTINWPLWANGGMQLQEDLLQMMSTSTGLSVLPSTQGLVALDYILSQHSTQTIVLYGEERAIKSQIQKLNALCAEQEEETASVITRICCDHFTFPEDLKTYWKNIKAGQPISRHPSTITEVQSLREQGNDIQHLLIRTQTSRQIEAVICGKGKKTVLLFCGFGLTASQWYYQIKELREDCQFIIIHPPGVGLSEDNGDLTFQGISNTFREVLDILQIPSPLYVVGTSWGGMLAQTFTAKFPEKVVSLALVTSFCDMNQLWDEQSLKDAFQLDFYVNYRQGAYELIQASKFANSVAFQYNEIERQGKLNTYKILGDISVPTLIVSAKRDIMGFYYQTNQLVTKIPQAALVEINGGHGCNITHYEEFNRILLQYLQEHE